MPIDRDALTVRQSYLRAVAGALFAIAGVYSLVTASAFYLHVGAIIMLIAAATFVFTGLRGLRTLARLRGENSS